MIEKPTMIHYTLPYAYQTEALLEAWGNPGFAYFMEMGTGKSKIIIDEIINLNEQGLINCVVILAPNNVHVNWKNELEKHGPGYDKWEIQIWRSGQNEKKREETTRQIIASGKLLVFLMNIEALSTKPGKEYLHRLLLARRRAYFVIDESHKIKSNSAIRTKAAIELGKLASIRRIATGTEAEEGLENLYSQFKFLDPNIIGIRSFTAFRSMFCIMGGYENREVKGYQNQELLAQRIAPYIYSKRKKDCLDLPDKVYVRHEIEMTPQQLKLYRQLEDELLLELNSGQLVDATVAMVRMMRLQQILCGHINSSEGERRPADIIPSTRADYVAEIVDEASSKVIIFCRFIMDVQLVCNALGKNDIGSIGISSLVEGNRRLDEIDRWRNDKNIKALVITSATGGVGLTLNEATTTIFYSNSWSATDRMQAEDRNHRIGQNSKVTYHDLYVKNKVDHRLLYALNKKRFEASMFRNMTNIKTFLMGEDY
jgi:SNF2 family DNA or RNA helicase